MNTEGTSVHWDQPGWYVTKNAPYITITHETTNSHEITSHDITGILYMYIGVVIYTYLVCNILIPNIPNILNN